MTKPFINLPSEPGILALFSFDKGVGKQIFSFAEEIMRRPSPLTIGEREMIAAFVSKLNECNFCCESHTACTKEFLDPDVVDQFMMEQNSEVFPDHFTSLLAIAAAVQAFDRFAVELQIDVAKEYGATEQEIFETITIASFFCMCNRLVDCTGATHTRQEAVEGGKGLAKYGYLFGVKRFFGEVVPKLFSKIAS